MFLPRIAYVLSLAFALDLTIVALTTLLSQHLLRPKLGRILIKGERLIRPHSFPRRYIANVCGVEVEIILYSGVTTDVVAQVNNPHLLSCKQH